MKNGILALALTTVAAGGCVGEARMAMPSDLAAATDRIEMTGIGHGESGHFQLGASTGTFRRGAAEHRSDDGFFVWNRGGGDFTVTGPDVGGALSGGCLYREDRHDAGSVEITARPFAYRCRFDRNGEPLDAGLVLDAVPRSPGRLLSAATLAGTLHYGGRAIGIRAIHDMEGGRVPSGTPLGYMFDVGGRPIGAIDVNGAGKTIYAPRSGEDREVVLAGAVALAILWYDGG